MLNSVWTSASGVKLTTTFHEHSQSNSLQHFRFCCFGLSLFFYFICVLITTSALFVPSGGCKKSIRTINQGCYISDLSLKIIQHSIIVVVFVVSSVYLLFRPFSNWVVRVFLLDYCMITLRICCLYMLPGILGPPNKKKDRSIE